ncbi:MAG: hypothetical protein ABSC01_01640, partial [Verrucomicrobiota bacterium]
MEQPERRRANQIRQINPHLIIAIGQELLRQRSDLELQSREIFQVAQVVNRRSETVDRVVSRWRRIKVLRRVVTAGIRIIVDPEN